jgi:hypothetical protein
MDEAGNIKIYDVDGNEVALNVNGKYRINVVVVLPVTSALMVPLPLSYNLFATNCAKEVISAAVPLEEGLSVSQPTKAVV